MTLKHDIENIVEDEGEFNAASRGSKKLRFAASGGVAKSVVDGSQPRCNGTRRSGVANAEGLKECKKLLQLAKAGKYNGYLLEGEWLPGGCGRRRNNAAGEEIPDGSLPRAAKAGRVTSDRTGVW